jgi:hypothetical protein
MKAGYQTTEFWLTLTSQLLGLLTLFHVISPQDSGTLTTAVANGITAIFTIVACARVVLGYIESRTNLKLGSRGPGSGSGNEAPSSTSP